MRTSQTSATTAAGRRRMRRVRFMPHAPGGRAIRRPGRRDFATAGGLTGTSTAYLRVGWLGSSIDDDPARSGPALRRVSRPPTPRWGMLCASTLTETFGRGDPGREMGIGGEPTQAAAAQGLGVRLLRADPRAGPVAADESPLVRRENIPAAGGCVLAANHISHARPADLRALRLRPTGASCGSSPRRSSSTYPCWDASCAAPARSPSTGSPRDASLSFTAAVQAVRAGECVVVYPEGTITRQPELWPMTGKTGAARIALAAGVPVVPGRAVGRAGHPRAVRPAARTCCPARPSRCRPARPSTSTTCAGSRSPPSCCAGRPTGSWTT